MAIHPGGDSAPERITDIHIRFAEQTEQRYPTLGDWQLATLAEGAAELRITITQMPDQRMSWPLALHELAEALLCHSAGITTSAVDEWDIYGEGRHLEEPGDDPRAPYHPEHMAAGELEIAFAQALGFTADEYDTYTDRMMEHDNDSE